MSSRSDSAVNPSLRRVEYDEVVIHLDSVLRERGILVAFTERSGGVSVSPYESLNLAAHVGDAAVAVDTNRTRLFGALGIAGLRERLVTAEQVHGERIEVVGDREAGSGAFAEPSHGSRPPVPATDALVTSARGLPLMMFFADCVPIVLVATSPRPAVAVVHAGWRGARLSLPGTAASALAAHAGCAPSDISAYIGPHIARCCYEVDERLLSHFCNIFDTVGALDGRLDLAAAVRESLARSGVSAGRTTSVGACTHDLTDRFFSYRAESTTGRHGALAVITEGE